MGDRGARVRDRNWIVPALALLVLGALALGLVAGGGILERGDETSEPSARPPAGTETEGGDTGTAETTTGESPSRTVTLKELEAHMQTFWTRMLLEQGRDDYEPPAIRSGRLGQSRCTDAARSGGPFYCPEDRTVYLDPRFLRALSDPAQAYVLAHLVAHHIQIFIGVHDAVRTRQVERGRDAAARLGVAYELQADCFAGIWAAEAESAGLLALPEFEPLLEQVASVASRRIEIRGNQLLPEIFEHAPAESRASWFERGREAGDPALCDPFPDDER